MSGKYIIEASWEKIIEDDYDTALEFLLKARTDVNEHFADLSEEQKIDLDLEAGHIRPHAPPLS